MDMMNCKLLEVMEFESFYFCLRIEHIPMRRVSMRLIFLSNPPSKCIYK